MTSVQHVWNRLVHANGPWEKRALAECYHVRKILICDICIRWKKVTLVTYGSVYEFTRGLNVAIGTTIGFAFYFACIFGCGPCNIHATHWLPQRCLNRSGGLKDSGTAAPATWRTLNMTFTWSCISAILCILTKTPVFCASDEWNAILLVPGFTRNHTTSVGIL